MGIWNANGVASVANGATTVATTADFRANFIEVGKGFTFPGEGIYQITALNERNGVFTIEPAYAGASKTDQGFWVLPFLGVAQAAERALREATDALAAVMSPDPFDLTAGRILRVGDFGEQGYPSLLSAEHDLNEVTVPGLYYWRSDNVPTVGGESFNTYATGSHWMRVVHGYSVSRTQTVWRNTSVGSSMITWWRNLFPNASPTNSSPFTRDYTSQNLIGPVSASGGVPTGALIQVEGNEDPFWQVERYAWGTQMVRMEFPVDVETTTTQSLSYPSGFNFIGGGKTTGGYSLRSTNPNAALSADNVRLSTFNSSIAVNLEVAGTSVDPLSDAERLMVWAEGRWFS